jgi:hypothetical protein
VCDRRSSGGINGSPPSITVTIQVLVICAKFGSMKDSRILSDGSGCSIIIVIAKSILSPNLLECGRKVCALQFIHLDEDEKNSWFVFNNMSHISCSFSALFRSSEYRK